VHRYIRCFTAALLLILAGAPAFALTQITSLPFTANTAGETYYLAGDLSYSGGSNAITVSANNITIQGSGSGGTTSPDWKITHSGSSGDIINSGTVTGLVIRDIELVRTGAGDCIDEGAGSITLYRVRTFNSGAGGVNCFKTAGDATAESCIFARSVSGTVAVACTGTSKTRSFTNCTFYGVATAMLTVTATGITNATNCIFYEASSGSTVAVNDAGGAGTATYSHNFYGKSTMATQHNIVTANGVTYVDSGGGTNITTLDATATASATHPFQNADGTATANYRLFSTNTNCQNNGTNVNSYSTDVADSTRVVATTIDRGAHERQSAATPTGACCTPAVAGYGYGTCAITTQAACTGGGKTYEGDDTVCSPNPCPYVARFTVTPGSYAYLDDAAAAAQYDRCTNPANPSYPYLNGLYTSFKAWVDAQPVIDEVDSGDNPEKTNTAQMVAAALMYRLTGSSTYLNQAKAEMGFIGGTFEGYVDAAHPIGGSVLSDQSACALGYSFVRGGLTGPERTAWVARLVALNGTLDAASGESVTPWRWHNTSITAALNVLTDGNGGTYDQQKLDANLGFYADQCVLCLERVSKIGYFEDYSGQKALATIAMAEATKNMVPALGDTLDVHLDNGWKFWVTRIRGEVLAVGGETDRIAIERQAGKQDLTDISEPVFMGYYSGPRAQPVAAAWWREFYAQGCIPSITGRVTAMEMLPALMWANPGLSGATIADTPKIITQDVHGVTYVRQGYALDSANTYLNIGFYPFNVRFAAETAWGGIMIRRGPDNGVIRSGWRMIDYDKHYSPYHNRSIAASSVRIYDAAEGIYTPGIFYLDQWKGALVNQPTPCDNILRTTVPPNDGGDDSKSLDGANPDWEAAAIARVPECNYPATHPGYFVQGSTLAFDALDGLYWRQVASGDSAYAQTKQSGVKRSVSYLFDSKVLLIDEVVNDKASTPVYQDLHFPRVARFNVSAGITKIAGSDTIGVASTNTATDPPGGDYTTPVAAGSYIRTVNGNSQFVFETMFSSTLASTSTKLLELVGGPNRAGAHFRQDHNPNDTYTYNPSNPSFEWDIFGDNYCPGNYSCATFANPMADGSYVTKAEGVRVITDPDWIPAGWNDLATRSDGWEAGTWRGSTKVTPASAGDTVLIVTAIWAADKNVTPQPLNAFSKRGGTLAFLYDANDDPGTQTLKMSIQRMPRFAGQRLKNFSWTKPTAGFTTPATIATTAFGAIAGRVYSIRIDSDGNGTYDVEGGTYTADAEGVLRFTLNYSNYVTGRADTLATGAGTGACCAANGSCSILSASACDAGGGSYLGDTEPCLPFPCGNSLGVGDVGTTHPVVGIVRSRELGGK